MNREDHLSYTKSVPVLNGGILLEGSFPSDLDQDTRTWYYETGGVESSATFKNGKKEQDQIFYRETGRQTKIEYYQEGELVDEELLLK